VPENAQAHIEENCLISFMPGLRRARGTTVLSPQRVMND